MQKYKTEREREMYRVIIADDEKVIRDSLSKVIDWNRLGFEVVQTFQSGEEVIECLEYMSVDLVITDVKMPRITGIDIIKYIGEQQLECMAVMISGYKEFELVHQAIKYGAIDYLLKPIQVSEVNEMLRKVKEQLDKRTADQCFRQKNENRLKTLLPEIEEKFISDLMTGMLDKPDYIRERMGLLYPEIDPENCPCMLTDMEIDNYQLLVEDVWNCSMEQVDESMKNFTSMLGEKAVFYIVYKRKEQLRVFLIMKDYSNTEEENQNNCKNQMEFYRQQFSEVFKTNLIEKQARFYKNVFSIQENAYLSQIQGDEVTDIQLMEKKKMIITNIYQRNIGGAQKILNNILDDSNLGDLWIKKKILVEIFTKLNEFLRENDASLLHMLEALINYQYITNASSVEELKKYCNRILDKLKSKNGEKTEQCGAESIVDKVIRYVDQHIMEDLTMEDVAEKLYISTAHLSKSFKKQTGETFLQFLTKKKMEKAIVLLQNPKYKIYQVSDILGYRSTRYFSKLFYGHIGYYPSQYRKMVLRIGEDDE